MTLFPDHIEMFANEYDSDMEIQYQAPKLPFDVNDYLNFELNEDLILANGDFANDYATSSSDSKRSIVNSVWDEHDHDIIESEHLMGSIDKDEQNDLTFLTYKNELFGNDDCEDDNKDVSRCGELDEAFVESTTFSNAKVFNQNYDDDYVNNDFESNNNYIMNTIKEPPTLPSNDFKIFNLDHEDLKCNVITRLKNSPCKKKITCTFHSVSEKSTVPRCDSVEKLIRNFKYLQKLRHDIVKYSKSTTSKNIIKQQNHRNISSVRLKRHNSYDDTHMIKKKRSLSQLNPMDILNGQNKNFTAGATEYAVEDDDEDDEFINTLILKVSLLKEDPKERLLDFQYQTELKNLATIEYYNQNKF